MAKGWTEEEVAAELRRRREDQFAIERERGDAARAAKFARANTTCGHCGMPIEYYGRNPFPLCDVCDGD